MLGAIDIWKEALDTFDTQDPMVLKPQLLRRLYDLLSCWSSDLPSQHLPVKFTDICNLSNIFFRELSRRFNQLFSHIGLDPVSVGPGQGTLHSDTWDCPRDLIHLLRCCMAMLHLLELNHTLLLEKSQTLLTILSKLCSPELLSHISSGIGGNERSSIRLKRSVSRECVYDDEGGTTSIVEESESSICLPQQSGSFIPLLCSIIEVFIDELLVHRQLRQIFMMADTISGTNEKLFMCHLNHGDSDAVLELISSHFLLSVSDEQAFNKSLETFYPWYTEEPPLIELSLTASMQLLGSSALSTAPQILQAYMITLVARCIGTKMNSERQRSDQRLINCYLSSFERSFILYARYRTNLESGNHPDKAKTGAACSDTPTLLDGAHPSFKSYVRPFTYEQILVQATKFANSSQCFPSKQKSGLLNTCITYMEKSQSIFAEAHKDEIFSFLNCIISRTLSDEIEGNILQREKYKSREEMYLLASLVTLMSSSLLQTIWFMRDGSVDCVEIPKDYTRCTEYGLIAGVIGGFRQFRVSHYIQSLLHDVMPSERHKDSKLMFMHFTELLLLSFESELEFLCKGCIFMMITLSNLFIFEEGNLDALKPLIPVDKSVSIPSPNKQLKILVRSRLIAAKFQEIQRLNIRTEMPIQSETSRGALLLQDVEENVHSTVEQNTCNGAEFLKSIQGNKKMADFDELVDFIECKRGKDYSSWLKDREKYRKWKYEKTEVVRKSKRKRALGLLI